MRICLYTGSALPKLGGQEAVVDQLARHLQRLGHEPTVLAPRPRLPLWPRDRELPYPVLRHPRFYSTEVGVDWYRWFLLRAHRRCRFDVVHCHDVYPTGHLAVAARAALGVPVVITSHGGDVRPGNRLLAKPMVKVRIRAALETADALVSIGRFTTDGFLAAGASGRNLHAIPNGVDCAALAEIAPRPADLDVAIVPGRYVLFIGRLADRKGVDQLLAGLSRLPPTGGVELVIAGSGDRRSFLEATAARLGVAGRVRFVGRAEGSLKSYLLQNAAAVAVPSRGWEAFPLVVLEAYAVGRPVLASRIPGLEDVVDDGVTGLLVDPESPAGWATALSQAMADEPWRFAAGAAARTVAAAHDWPRIAQRHVDLYREVRSAAHLPAI